MRIEGRRGAHLQAAILTLYARATRRWHKRGLGRATWLLGRLFHEENSAVLERNGGWLRVPLNDGYWTCLLDPKHRYESELDFVVELLVGPDTNFLDCGANVGYWSIMAQHRARKVVAVEASPYTFRRLEDNLALNGGKVVSVHAAIWSDDAQTLEVVSHRRLHVDGSVVEGRENIGRPGFTVEPVPSISIDSLVARYCAPGRVVVKLDVEGAELQAIEGAKRTIRERPLAFLYEDHGRDMDCSVSAYLLDSGYCLYALSADKPPVPIDRLLGIAVIRALKTDPLGGYNFLALSPTGWHH